MAMVFNPVGGLNDVTQFPDTDPLIRSHLQVLLQQIPDYVDVQLAEKANTALENVIVPTLQNAWVNYDSVNNSTVGYYKDNFEIVHLKGTLKSGAMSAVMFVLPAGYRPVLKLFFSTNSNGAFGSAQINSDGSVFPIAGSNTYFCLDGITFRAGV